jgi:adenylate cyclase
VTAALGLVALALGVALAWAWRRGAALRQQLDDASAELERLQQALRRFAPHALADEIVATGVSTRGERREVTALFADLVGFTPIADRTDPDVLVRVLNGYYERMSAAIGAHHGHISTLIGDGILALFGALQPNPWHSNDAAHAALAMQRTLAAYNRELAGEQLPALALGVGLHRGTGVAGLVGSRDLLQFTVVGPTVTVAARVQDLTRLHRAEILATEAVARALDPRFETRPLPPVPVQGLAEPLATWSIAGFGGAGA